MKKLIFIGLLSLSQALWSEDSNKKTIDFESSLAKAMGQNESIKIGQKKLLQSQNTAELAIYYLLPQLYLQGGVTQSWIDDLNANSVSVSPGSGIPIGGDNANFAKTALVGLNWTLFDGMRMFKAQELVRENESLEKLNFESTKSDLKENFSKAWVNVLINQFRLKLLQKRLEVSEAMSLRLRDKYDFGLVDRRQNLQALLSFRQAKVAVLEQERLTQSAMQNLNLIMGDATKEMNAELSRDLPKIEIPKGLEEAWNELNQKSLILKVQDKKLELAYYNYGLERSKHFPMITAFADYGWSQSESNYGNSFPLVDRENATGRIGLNLRWNLFSGFDDEMSRRNARIDVEMAQISSGLIKKQLRLALEDVFESYQISLSTYAIEKESQGLGIEQWEISQEMYAAGQITQLEYLNAQILMESVELSLFSAQMNVFLAKVNIENQLN
jgi:outer membrane protein